MTRVRQYSGSQRGMGGGYLVTRVVDVATVGPEDVIVDPATPLADWATVAAAVDVSISLLQMPTGIAAGETATIAQGNVAASSEPFAVLGELNVLGTFKAS